MTKSTLPASFRAKVKGGHVIKKRKRKNTSKVNRVVWDKKILKDIGVGVVNPDMVVDVKKVQQYLKHFMEHRYASKRNEAKTVKSYLNSFSTTFAKLFNSVDAIVLMKHLIHGIIYQTDTSNETADRLLVSWYYFCCKYRNEDFTTTKTTFRFGQLSNYQNFQQLMDNEPELKSWIEKKAGHIAYFLPKNKRLMKNARRELLEKSDRKAFVAKYKLNGIVLTKERLLSVLEEYDEFIFGKRDERLQHDLTDMGQHQNIEVEGPEDVVLSNELKSKIFTLINNASNSSCQ